METFTLGVALFTLIVISLVTLIIFAKIKLSLHCRDMSYNNYIHNGIPL